MGLEEDYHISDVVFSRITSGSNVILVYPTIFGCIVSTVFLPCKGTFLPFVTYK